MNNALHQIATWVATVSAENFPEQWSQAKQWALISLVDTVGCIIGGSDHPATLACYQTSAPWSQGDVTVIGQSNGLATPWAALVNGTAGHALDFNGWDAPTASNSLPVMWRRCWRRPRRGMSPRSTRRRIS
ncbi:MAG: MmgE/PrpD family protein [Candidatus Promineifilaceae bacterium]